MVFVRHGCAVERQNFYYCKELLCINTCMISQQSHWSLPYFGTRSQHHSSDHFSARSTMGWGLKCRSHFSLTQWLQFAHCIPCWLSNWMLLVGRFSMYRSLQYIIMSHTVVTLTHKKKIPFSGPSPNLLALTLILTVTPHPNHLATSHCRRLQCTTPSLTYQSTLQYNIVRCKTTWR